MSRTKHSVSRRKRVKKILKMAKGFRGDRGRRYRRAKETLMKSLTYAYRDRKTRKRNFRRLWIVRLNAAVRARGLKYGEFIAALKKKKIELSRDILSQLAIEEPRVFDQLVEEVKAS